MKILLTALVCVVLIALASAARQGAPGLFSIAGFAPHIPLAVALAFAARVRPGVAALLGFFAGVFLGGSAGADLTAFVLSTTVVCFALSWPGQGVLSLSTPVVMLGVAIATLCCLGLFVLLAPSPDISGYLRATLGTAIYNGVLAAPLDMVLRRVLGSNPD